MTLDRLQRILSKRPSWVSLRVLLEWNCINEYSYAGRHMAVRLDTGEEIQVSEGNYRIHTYMEGLQYDW